MSVGRRPLDGAAVRDGVVGGGRLWTALEVVGETGSTNADVMAAARGGAAEGLVLVAERQTAGRGRLGRDWVSPVGAGLTVSVLLRPAVPVSRYGWLPPLAGVAVATGVRRMTGLDARLKWPNDVLLDDRKCGGILAELDGDGAVVVGFGLNVTLREDELPRPDATSLALAGATGLDRGALLVGLLTELERCYTRWCDAGGDPQASGVRAAYQELCATVGRTVTVSLPGGGQLVGLAEAVDADGRLVVAGRPVAAGDVVHVR